VDTCVPGDMVTVSGIVKVTNSDEGLSSIFTSKIVHFLFVFETWHRFYAAFLARDSFLASCVSNVMLILKYNINVSNNVSNIFNSF